MSNLIMRVFLLLLIYSACAWNVVAQDIDDKSADGRIVTGTPKSRQMTPEVRMVQEAIDSVLAESGNAFREGLTEYSKGHRIEARCRFNRSIEVFLYSKMNLQKDQRLHSCYEQLIETVYRIEFPSEAQVPQIRSLAATCNWDIKSEIMEVVSRLSLPNQPGDKSKDDESKILFVSENPSVPAAKPIEVRERQNETGGLASQKFDISAVDELANLEASMEESWKSISNRTGVSAEELIKANPGKSTPSGKIFIPSNGANSNAFIYEVPNSVSPNTESTTTRVVRAKAGDTVEKIAVRENSNPTVVAKYNGLLPSSVLSAGRSIRIPIYQNIPSLNLSTTIQKSLPLLPNIQMLGPKPKQMPGGKISVVMSYFNETLHDPYTMRIIRWSPIFKAPIGNELYWAVTVKFRAKNRLGAWVLDEMIFYFRDGRIVSANSLS